jgi:hypothetical protein
VVAFRLRRTGAHGYDVEPVTPEDEVFARFVNDDLYGVQGLQEMLELARAIRAGAEPPLDEVRNIAAIELGPHEVTITDDEWGRSARCTTDEFIAFLESILAGLAERADA